MNNREKITAYQNTLSAELEELKILAIQGGTKVLTSEDMDKFNSLCDKTKDTLDKLATVLKQEKPSNSYVFANTLERIGKITNERAWGVGQAEKRAEEELKEKRDKLSDLDEDAPLYITEEIKEDSWEAIKEGLDELETIVSGLALNEFDDYAKVARDEQARDEEDDSDYDSEEDSSSELDSENDFASDSEEVSASDSEKDSKNRSKYLSQSVAKSPHSLWRNSLSSKVEKFSPSSTQDSDSENEVENNKKKIGK